MFPSNFVGKFLVKAGLKVIPNFSIEWKRSVVKYGDKVTAVQYVRLDSGSRYSTKNTNNLKVAIGLVINDLRTSSTHQAHTIHPLLSTHTAKLTTKFSINTTTGEIHSIHVKTLMDDLRVSVFKFIKLYLTDIETRIDKLGGADAKDVDPAVQEAEAQRKARRLERLVGIFKVVYEAINEISVVAQNLNVFEIPFITTDCNESFKAYLQQEYPITALELKTKSIHLHLQKLSKTSAGFHALFESADDKPINISNSVQLLTVNFAKWKNINGSFHKNQVEVLNIPTYSLSCKANYFDKLIRGEGFQNCIAELFWTCSNPILDLDSPFLTSLLHNIVILRKLMKFKSLQRQYKLLVSSSYSTDDDIDDTQQDYYDFDETLIDMPEKGFQGSKTPLKDKLWRYLQEYYPKLDVKFIIEQPRLVVRHTSTTSIDILDFSYSSLNFSVITTKTRDYNLNCSVLAPAISYAQNSIQGDSSVKFDIVSLKSFVADVQVLKNLKFKFDFNFESFHIDFSNLTTLVGIKTIVNQLTRLIEMDLQRGHINLFLNSRISKYRTFVMNLDQENPSDVYKTLKETLFNYLPAWFVELNVVADDVDFKFGSRSVLIPKEKLSEMLQEYDLKDFLESDSSCELRCFRIQLGILRFGFENNCNPHLDLSTSSLSSASSDTLTSKQDQSISYWGNNLEIKDFVLSAMSDFSGPRHYGQCIAIPNVSIDVGCKKIQAKENLNVSINLNKIEGKVDHFKCFTIIGAGYLLMEHIVRPLQSIQSKLKKDAGSISEKPSKSNFKSLKDCITISSKIKRTDLSVTLSGDYKVRLDSYETRISLADDTISIYDKYFRVLISSPTVEDHWCRLICTDDFQFHVNLHDIRNLYVNTSLIKIAHPHGHIAYKLFDNISITLKVLKHSIRAFNSGDAEKDNDFTVVHPSESRPKEFPNINFKTNKLMFNMEDDPFESELGMIFQLGKVEQLKRIELYSLFQAKTQNLQSTEKHDEIKSIEDINDENDLPGKLDDLNEIISVSWIRKVKRYKTMLNDELVKNKKFLFGNEAKLDSRFQSKILPYSLHAPLLSIVIDSLNMVISKPTFDLETLPKFLHDLGQGLPFDTRYSLILPMYLDLRMRELRIHLRDYPLPLLYVSNSKAESASAVKMYGDLVISESLVTEEHNIRKLMVDLTRNLKKFQFSEYYRLEIEKTMATVKIFTDMKIEFSTKLPSRFVWGQSYQFAIQQVMLNFDSFSKPPLDPSPKLGFWDKLRLVIHGKFDIKCTKGPLEVAFKGSRDPYNLFGVASGFILSFKDNVVWTINQNDDSRDFCNVKSDKISWYIPNYLASGLVSWTRETNRLTYLPNSKKFITSCYAYYLDDEDYCIPRNKVNSNIFEKKVVSLSGGVVFKVGFVLQRDGDDGQRTEECKSHYDVKLFNPQFTEEGHDSYKDFRSDYINMAISMDANFSESYNSIHLSPRVFMQFFDWWKLFSSNMQLPIKKGKIFGELKKSEKFSQHLVSNRFKFNLKSLFISHIYREENSEEMEDQIQSCGLKGKMNSFVVDLHQRKEKRIAVHEGISRNKNIMKMTFHIADVHLNGIDLRVVTATFDHNAYNTPGNVKESKYDIFDNDEQWFDIEDYEEAFLSSLASSKRQISVLPLMYSERFSYLRDTEPGIRFKEVDLFESGKASLERIKDVARAQKDIVSSRIKQLKDEIKLRRSRGLSTKDLVGRIDVLKKEMSKASVNLDRRPSVSDFNTKFSNKFIVMRMLWKWNDKNRNNFFKYVHFVQLRTFLKRYLSFDSISALEEIVEYSTEGLDRKSTYSKSEHSPGDKFAKLSTDEKSGKSRDRLTKFDEILTQVAKNENLVEDYLIEIISPQIQLQSSETPDSVIIVSSPMIDAKLVSIYDKSKDRLLLDIDELENRLAVMINNANVLVFEKNSVEDNNSFIFDQTCYGSTSSWPPWLGIEICNQATLAGSKNVLLEDTSVMITYIQSKPTGAKFAHDSEGDDLSKVSTNTSKYFDLPGSKKENIQNKLHVDIPTVNITSTSAQYFSLYSIITNLLLYTEPSNKQFNDKLEKLKFSINFQDLAALYDRIKALHLQNGILNLMSNNYNFRQDTLDNESLNDFITLKTIQQEISNELYLLLHSMLTGNSHVKDSSKSPKAEWIINADELILHMLEDDRTPILDIAMATGKFTRIVNEDDSNINRIEISMIQGFNLLRGAIFPAFIEPMDHKDELQNLLTVDWSMYSNVGGIRLIENFEVNAQPLSVRMDKITGDKLMHFLFKTELADLTDLGDNPMARHEAEVTNDLDFNGKASNGDEKSKVNFDTSSSQSDPSDSESSTNPDQLTIGSPSKRVTNRSSHLFPKSFTQSSGSEQQYDEQLDVMVNRSKNYVSVNSLKVNPVSLSISIKLKGGYKRLLNVEDFKLVLPEILIQKKILSVLEFTMIVRKILVRAILGHLGGLVRNKFKRSKRKPMNLINKPLKPLKRYARFTSVTELRGGSNEDP
ncbi:Protein SABRE [Yamadazyma tenuis]|nr:Protein SABRE [Yamadazyma tenuis]